MDLRTELPSSTRRSCPGATINLGLLMIAVTLSVWRRIYHTTKPSGAVWVYRSVEAANGNGENSEQSGDARSARREPRAARLRLFSWRTSMWEAPTQGGLEVVNTCSAREASRRPGIIPSAVSAGWLSPTLETTYQSPGTAVTGTRVASRDRPNTQKPRSSDSSPPFRNVRKVSVRAFRWLSCPT